MVVPPEKRNPGGRAAKTDHAKTADPLRQAATSTFGGQTASVFLEHFKACYKIWSDCCDKSNTYALLRSQPCLSATAM